MRTYIRRTAEQWQSLIDEQRASALSAPKFCEQHNVGYASFCSWRNRLALSSITEVTDDPTQTEPNFVAVDPIPIQAANPQWVVELQLGSDVVLRIDKS